MRDGSVCGGVRGIGGGRAAGNGGRKVETPEAGRGLEEFDADELAIGIGGAHIDDMRFGAFAGGFIDEEKLLASIDGALESHEAAPETDLDGVGFADGEALVGAGLKDAQRNTEGNAAAAASLNSVSARHTSLPRKAPIAKAGKNKDGRAIWRAQWYGGTMCEKGTKGQVSPRAGRDRRQGHDASEVESKEWGCSSDG